MKMQTQTIIKNLTRRVHPNVVDVVVTIGGLNAEIVKYHGRRKSTYTFMFDNPTDLDAWVVVARRFGINTISLGQGETTSTLTAKQSEYVKSVFRRVATMNATTGCGASPLVGFLVGAHRVLLDDFRTLLRRLAARIRSLTNNTPSMIRLRIKCSSCGGTGAGGFRPIAEAFLRELVKLGVNVQLELELTGSFAFCDTSDSCRLTAAAVLPMAIATVLDRSAPNQERVTRHLTIGDCPVTDKSTRDALVLFEEAALTCPQFRDRIELIRPNQSTKCIYGNVMLKECDHFFALDLADIAGEVASFYLRELNQASEEIAPDSSLLQLVDYVEQHRKLSPKPIDTILESLSQFSLPTLLAAIKQPEAQYEYRLDIVLSQGTRFDSRKLRTFFISKPETLSETVAIAKLIETFIERLRRELSSIQSTVQAIQSDIDHYEALFTSSHQAITGGRLWRWKLNREEKQLSNAAFNLRGLVDDLANQRAAESEISRVLFDLMEERELINERLRAVSDLLRSHLSDGSIEAGRKSIVPVAIELVYGELLKALRLPIQQQAEMLRTCAGLVTLAGLSRILGAAEATPESIADAIVYGDPRFLAVSHGGLNQQDAPNVIYVLPPLEDHEELEIASCVHKLQPRAETVFMNTLAGGASALRFKCRFPSSIEQIMCGNLMHDLQEVLDSQHVDLFFPGDLHYAELAGLRIAGNQFEFFDPTPAKSENA